MRGAGALATALCCWSLAGPRALAQPAEHALQDVRFEVLGGMGLGTRALRRPTAEGVQPLDDTPFVAADLALRLHAWRTRRLSAEMQLRYQTSLGLSVQERPLFSLPNEEVDVRAERVELGVAPRLRLAEGRSALSLAFPVGATLRAFWPDVRELTTPAYSLFGPHVRVELLAPLTSWLGLRVGPELHVIVLLDEMLQRGGAEDVGYSLGGEAALSARLTSALSVELTYRESHAFVANRGAGEGFEDVERFATARVVGAL